MSKYVYYSNIIAVNSDSLIGDVLIYAPILTARIKRREPSSPTNVVLTYNLDPL